MNGYLKEITVLCGIEKNNTFHLVRRTFDTMITSVFIFPKINELALVEPPLGNDLETSELLSPAWVYIVFKYLLL